MYTYIKRLQLNINYIFERICVVVNYRCMCVFICKVLYLCQAKSGFESILMMRCCPYNQSLKMSILCHLSNSKVSSGVYPNRKVGYICYPYSNHVHKTWRDFKFYVWGNCLFDLLNDLMVGAIVHRSWFKSPVY